MLKAWIALILWLIVIAIESTTYLSSQNTSRFLYPLLHFVFGIDYASFEPYHAVLRKLGHVCGYGLLSILLYRAWRETLSVPGGGRWALRWASIAVVGTALVASLDEWHQAICQPAPVPCTTSFWTAARESRHNSPCSFGSAGGSRGLRQSSGSRSGENPAEAISICDSPAAKLRSLNCRRQVDSIWPPTF